MWGKSVPSGPNATLETFFYVFDLEKKKKNWSVLMLILYEFY